MSELVDLNEAVGLSPRAALGIRQRVQAIFGKDNEGSEEQLDELAQLVFQHKDMLSEQNKVSAAAAIFFNEVFEVLAAHKDKRYGSLHQFLVLQNHLPILENSLMHGQTLKLLTPYLRKNLKVIKDFDQIQLLNTYVEIGHFDAAKALAEELKETITDDIFEIYVLFEVCRLGVYDYLEDSIEKIRDNLALAQRILRYEGPCGAIYFMFKWMCAISYFKKSRVKKLVLNNLYRLVKEERSLNAVMVGYQLFSLEEHLIDPQRKLTLYHELISYEANVLNVQQLHSLHFFAGSYTDGSKESFYNTVQNFVSSNYFLHKSWERLMGLSKYLRLHSPTERYKSSIASWEGLLLDLSAKTNFRNKLFVDNIQENYQKIEHLYKEVDELSLTDPLTGLRNRRFMENNMPQIVALASRRQAAISFVMMDIDHFKKVNDIYGHDVGDKVLRELGAMLSDFFRKSDIVIRYGGEEFLFVLFDISRQHCLELMQDLRMKIEKYLFNSDVNGFNITVSMGLRHEQSFSHLVLAELDNYIKEADLALYKAKEGGRNRVEEYREIKNTLDT